MNYRNENSTPRDRISAELFLHEYGTERGKGDMCRNTRDNCTSRTSLSCPRTCTDSRSSSGCTTERRTNIGCGCTTERHTNTGCGYTTEHRRCRDCSDRVIPAPTLAMSYIPMQQWRDLLDCKTALRSGTLFGELVFPFYPTPCCKRRDGNI